MVGDHGVVGKPYHKAALCGVWWGVGTVHSTQPWRGALQELLPVERRRQEVTSRHVWRLYVGTRQLGVSDRLLMQHGTLTVFTMATLSVSGYEKQW